MRGMKIIAIATIASIALWGCGKKDAPAPTSEQAERGAPESAATDEAEGERDDAAEMPERATLGKPAPFFKAKDQDGEEHELRNYRGKIVVLEWINPECPYVQRHHEAKTMATLAERYGERDVVWLGIDSSHFVKPEASKEFREKYGVRYPVLQDPTGAIGRVYEARTTPHMYIIDAEGILRYRGAIDDDPRGSEGEAKNYVDSALAALLAGEEIAEADTEPYGCTVKYEGS